MVKGPNGERTIAGADFFIDILTTALAEDEIVTGVTFPVLAAGTGTAYVKFEHPASHYALTGVAAAVKLDGSGNVESVKVGVTGVGPKAYRATAVEEALVGKGADAIADAASHAADGIDCNDDIHASAEYRAHLATVFARRALQAAFCARRQLVAARSDDHPGADRKVHPFLMCKPCASGCSTCPADGRIVGRRLTGIARLRPDVDHKSPDVRRAAMLRYSGRSARPPLAPFSCEPSWPRPRSAPSFPHHDLRHSGAPWSWP